MDGHSCDLGSVPAAVAAHGTGTSSAVAAGTDISPGKQSALDRPPRQGETADCSVEAGMCAGFSKSPGLGLKKDLQKCATFPSSAAEAEPEDSCCDADDDAPKDAHAYQRSASLPPTVKLIPAIKGSRQKNGIPLPAEDRHIKWAADVYDPPVSSVSHSVNNSYQRRPKPRKKDKTKQKEKRKARNKKKTNNAAQNQAVLQTPELEDLGTSIGSEAPADPGKLETEMLDYGISSQEAKCGSSFLLETAAKMHFSTAEAS